MKTKEKAFPLKFTSSSVVFFLFLASCINSNELLNSNDTQNVNAESASASYTNESSDIAASAVGGVPAIQFNGGRVDGKILGLGLLDDRLQCATITINFTGSNGAPSGTITINYGTTGACADAHGVIRKGQIIITYNGKRWMPGSTINLRMVNFYRNSAHIEGNLTLTTQISSDSLHLQFNSVLDSGKVTFGDGKFISRTHNLTREWIRATLRANDEWVTLANTGTNANGTAAGITKDGKTYSMQITKSLVEYVACRAEKVFIPVKGTKILTVGNDQYTIDYGDGTCDNIVSVTLNGKTKQITATADGN